MGLILVKKMYKMLGIGVSIRAGIKAVAKMFQVGVKMEL